MDKKFDEMTIHQKMELLVKDMVEKEVRYRDGLKEFQKIYLETALRKFKGNKSKMADSLGLHRNTEGAGTLRRNPYRPNLAENRSPVSTARTTSSSLVPRSPRRSRAWG